MNKQIERVKKSSVGWLVRQMSARMDAAMNIELKAHALDVRFFANLMALLEQDNLTQTELGQRSGEAQYTTSRLVDVLEERGLVERGKDPNSRRAHRIGLTNKGREMGKHLPAISSRVNDQCLARLTKKEREQLTHLLHKALDAG